MDLCCLILGQSSKLAGESPQGGWGGAAHNPQSAGDTLPRTPSVEASRPGAQKCAQQASFHLLAFLGMTSAPDSSPKVMASFVQGLNKVPAIRGPSGTTLTGCSSSRALARVARSAWAY